LLWSAFVVNSFVSWSALGDITTSTWTLGRDSFKWRSRMCSIIIDSTVYYLVDFGSREDFLVIFFGLCSGLLTSVCVTIFVVGLTMPVERRTQYQCWG
jgi:hypothetical protein